ncbi:hypothetical protein O9929_13460 [Vibrio lentus]|nr:hypothetical protein [Vibrio lentus]
MDGRGLPIKDWRSQSEADEQQHKRHPVQSSSLYKTLRFIFVPLKLVYADPAEYHR